MKIFIVLCESSFKILKIAVYPRNPEFVHGLWTLLYVKTHSDRKHKSKQTFDFGQNAGQRGKMCPTSKLIIQMHETRSPTKCESTVQAEISDGRKNLSLKH